MSEANTNLVFLCKHELLPALGKSRTFSVDMDPPADAGPLYLKSLKDGRNRVALFHTKEGLFACDDRCPHLEAPLADGKVHKSTVTCSWHFWQFDLGDGSSKMTQNIALRVFRVIERDGEIFLEINAEE